MLFHCPKYNRTSFAAGDEERDGRREETLSVRKSSSTANEENSLLKNNEKVNDDFSKNTLQSYGDYERVSSLWRQYRHNRNQHFEQARTISDTISKRRFFQDEDTFQSNNNLFPTGFGYGLIFGGVTFMAVSIPAMALARGPLGRLIGNRAAHVSAKTVALIAGGTVGNRYMQKQKTLENLKIMGTYITPTEPNHNADIICQHPAIMKAMDDQKKEHGKFGIGNDYSYSSHRMWSNSSTDQQILTELQKVLENCQVRAKNLERTLE